MSVFAALFSGVSGLQTFGSALGVIADNITNVNTVGYKESRANFTTLVTESNSTTGFAPGGVGMVAQTLVSRQGLLQASNSATDLSIDGAGFFVVRSATDPEAPDGEIVFTRAGSFTPDEAGFLKNTAGDFLMGWPLDSAGGLPTNLGDISALVPVRTSGLTGTAEATTSIGIRANLQSSQVVNANEALYRAEGDDLGTGGVTEVNMAGGGITPDFQRSVQVFDAQGGRHTLILAMLKGTTANQWHVEIYADPASEVNVSGANVNGQVATGTLSFNSDGSLDLANTSAALFGATTIDWNNGAADSTITIDFGSDGDTDGFTQFDSTSTLISSSVDGAVFGNVVGVSVEKDGTVTALFDNGLSRSVFKLPLATFQNPDGLTRRQGNAYAVSDTSGAFILVEAGQGGGGTIAPATLESSTVDLAKEFTELIITQRAFTASTRIITTADEMLDELNRIKR